MDTQNELANLARPGEVLMGKYRVDRVLGVGGMGAVVEARHIQLDDRVAIKFLLSSLADNEDVVTRFLREGRAAAKIRNEHVVRVFDVGTLENGSPYMVMEFLQGSDLSQIVERHGRMPVAQAVDWLLEACEAIAEAHAAGIVHRDLKPANLFLAERGDGTQSVKVLDFGISKLSESVDQQNFGMTKTQAVMGSPRYMSPEQMRSSRNVDARSDIWALGVVLHEMLAGVPPFDAETMPELCAKILAEPPPPLHLFRQDLPRGLDEALGGALQKDPAYRYQTVAQLAAALAPFGSPAATASANRAMRLSRSPLAQSDPAGRLSHVPPGAHGHGTGSQAWHAGSRGATTAAPSRGAGLWIGAALAAVLLLGALGAGGIYVLKTSSASRSAAAGAGAGTTATPAATVTSTAAVSAATTAAAPDTTAGSAQATKADDPTGTSAETAATATGTATTATTGNAPPAAPTSTGRTASKPTAVPPTPARPPAPRPSDDDIPATRQ